MLTAIFSIATAYGALIALVAPEQQPGGFALAAPFIFMGLAAILAMLSLNVGLDIKITANVDTINTALKTAVIWKRYLSLGAVVLIAIGIGTAARVVMGNYGPGAQPETADKEVEV